MNLTFEQQGQIFTMQVLEGGKKELPEGITGMRILNRIALSKRYFDDFIMAISIDDFETVRAIFAKVLDNFTRELPYSTGIDHFRLEGNLKENIPPKNVITF